MATPTTVPASQSPVFPIHVVKTITFIAPSQADLDYLNSVDEFPTDLLSFSNDIAIEIFDIDGKRV